MTTQEQIIAAAKEAGIKRAFVCANPDECPDDDACCYSQKPDGYWVKDEQLERFYAIAHEDGRQADKADAERYRFLRDNSAYVGVNPHSKTCLWVLRGIREIDGAGFDEAVDGAIRTR